MLIINNKSSYMNIIPISPFFSTYNHIMPLLPPISLTPPYILPVLTSLSTTTTSFPLPLLLFPTFYGTHAQKQYIHIYSNISILRTHTHIHTHAYTHTDTHTQAHTQYKNKSFFKAFIQ